MSDLIGALAILLLGLAIVAGVWLLESAIALYEQFVAVRQQRARLVWRPSRKSIARARAKARRHLL